MPKPKILTTLPFVEVHSPILKMALNVRDQRTVIKILEEAGVPIVLFGSKHVVMWDALVKAIEIPIEFVNSKSIVELSKHLQKLM